MLQLKNIFYSIFWLCCSCVYSIQESIQCPATCQCNSDEINMNVSYSSVWNCSSLTLSNLQLDGNSTTFNVRYLRLKNSTIDFKEDLSEFFPSLEKVELSNCSINLTCTKELLWLLAWQKKIINIEQMQCSYPKVFNGTSLSRALGLIKNLDTQCLKNCTCEHEYINKYENLTIQFSEHMYIRENEELITILMNCTNLQLKKLPELLPSNFTILLDLSDNQVLSLLCFDIRSVLFHFFFSQVEYLNELSTNPNYKQVTTLYLNNNKINSLSVLENSEWIKNFNVLSLQGNNVREVGNYLNSCIHLMIYYN